MSTTVKALIALLVLQLVAAVAMALSGPDISAPMEQRPLFELPEEEVDGIRITDAQEQVVQLTRGDDGWRVEEPDFPANDGQVDSLLNQLLDLQISQPVATSDSALERFQVAPEAFERRIVLQHGDDESVVYAGTSSGSQGGHVRRPDQDAVYSVGFASYEAPADTGNWLDSSVLQVSRESISRISTGGHTLSRTGSSGGSQDEASQAETGNGQGGSSSQAGWSSETAPEGRPLSPGAADRLAGQLASLTIDRVVSEEQFSSYQQEPVLTLELQRENGDAIDYRLFEHAGEDQYALETSLREERLGLASSAATRLIDAASESTLFPDPDAGSGNQPGGNGQPAAPVPTAPTPQP